MEKSPDLYSDDSGFVKESRAISIENLADCDTQDACDFQNHFDNDSNGSATENVQHNDKNVGKLKLNISQYFSDINAQAVRSPISDLALNVARTKISSKNCNHLTGKLIYESIDIKIVLKNSANCFEK